MATLAEWTEVNPPSTGGTKCWLCSIPQRAEADECFRNGRSVVSIWRGLIALYGYPENVATYHKVKGHFMNGRHHLQKITKLKGRAK